MIDGRAVVRHTDVGEPGGDVRRRLAPEAVLGRDHQPGVVPGLAQRLDHRPGDHQVTTLGQRRARRDDCHFHVALPRVRRAYWRSSGFTRTPRNRVSSDAPEMKIGTNPALLRIDTRHTRVPM